VQLKGIASCSARVRCVDRRSAPEFFKKINHAEHPTSCETTERALHSTTVLFFCDSLLR
jgi:hypothetical protein